MVEQRQVCTGVPGFESGTNGKGEARLGNCFPSGSYMYSPLEVKRHAQVNKQRDEIRQQT